MNNTHNYCIILAGGIGSRLWPMSQPQRPKQFLDPFGSGRTLLQSTYDRIVRIVPAANIYISTTSDYHDITREQLSEVPEANILAEPLRRGTFCALAWANAVITEQDSEANILVTPADQLILREDRFEEDMRQAFDYVAHTDGILTMGIRPTRPDTSYGYIQTEDELEPGQVQPIKSFTEKPDAQFAEMFMQSGEFLWNTGLYAFNTRSVLEMLISVMPDHVAAVHKVVAEQGKALSKAVEEHYGYMPNISLDKAVTEQSDNVFVRACSFGWADMGNWTSLYHDLPADREGNVRLHTEAMFYDGTGNVISLPHGEKAFVAGLSGYIICRQDGILMICPKGNVPMRRRMMNDAQLSLYHA